MKLLKKLIRLHKILFSTALLFTVLSVLFNLYWNRFLAETINKTGSMTGLKEAEEFLLQSFITAAAIVFFHAAVEYVSSYLASYTCEIFAHEMRMGYSRYYLQSDIFTLSKLNVGEEQSAMQNELREISSYLNENLFSFIQQFIAFIAAALFLFFQSCKLTLVSILPVILLLIYCYFSGRIIKKDTERCQKSREQINGMTDILLELFPIIQIYDAYSLIHRALEEKFSEWQNSNIRKERITARLMSVSGLLSFVPLLLLLGVGGTMVKNGEISIGIFYIFINLSGDVSGFLQNMPVVYAGFKRFMASVSRVEDKFKKGWG